MYLYIKQAKVLCSEEKPDMTVDYSLSINKYRSRRQAASVTAAWTSEIDR